MATSAPRPIPRLDGARIGAPPRSEPAPGRHAPPCGGPRRLPGTSSARRARPLNRRTDEQRDEQHSARAAAAALFRLIVDVLDQRRDTGHLRRAAAPAVIALLAERSRLHGTGTPPARILSVHVRPVSERCIEASCTCARGERAFALAARFETGRDGSWQCTALELG
ncbi:Rv3235 family protein [Lolliginicoccus suaedae]|uniref:Rv3235 family protein n=1 Tax=Lolliginicoccus suaedae TaxID=2605429 RepID=UPI0011EEB4EB|nr:Rv3235 family protein [Lolliginicoccus suaedae]